MEGEHDGGGEGHRRRTSRTRLPVRLESGKERGVGLRSDGRPLEHETQRALAVAEDKERGDEDDGVDVEAAQR